METVKHLNNQSIYQFSGRESSELNTSLAVSNSKLPALNKLTLPQKKALEKLTDMWQSSYELKIRRNVLDALVRKGLAEKYFKTGALYFPCLQIKYKRGKAVGKGSSLSNGTS